MGRNRESRRVPLTKEEFVEALMRLRELEEYGEWDEELEYEREYGAGYKGIDYQGYKE